MSLTKRFRGFITYEADLRSRAYEQARDDSLRTPEDATNTTIRPQEASGHDSWQCKHDNRRRSRTAKKPGNDARGGGDVLFAFQFVTHHSAADRAAGIELVERLAARR